MKIRELSQEKHWDYENGFYWFGHKSRINKLLAHYELYKLIEDLPGHIFELGVYKGASLIRFATFRETIENSYSRKIVGFDAFGKFPKEQVKLSDDINFIDHFESTGGEGLSKKDMTSIINSKGFENVELVEGNILETLPTYLKENPQTRIALLHLDMDVKEPTDFALDLLFDHIVPGGLIVFDDYNAVTGATKSADNFIKKNKLAIKKLPFYNTPSYVCKEA